MIRESVDEGIVYMVGDAVFLAYVPDNVSQRRVVAVCDTREEVVHNLIVESA